MTPSAADKVVLRGRPVGRRVAFDLRGQVFAVHGRAVAAREWIKRLGLTVPRGTPIRRFLADHLRAAAVEVGLPPFAPVMRASDAACERVPGISDRLAVALAVLSRCSEEAYLGMQEPDLSSLVPEARVVMLLPSAFRFPSEEVVP